MNLKAFLHSLALLLIVTVTANFGALSPGEVYFTTHPTISPDATHIVFSYEGDLWRVKTQGGTAFRLTGMPGNETNPRFSPDGQWIAFSGTAAGNENVYVMPATGGDIQQLTFNDGKDTVESWSWDSDFIYFTSNRESSFTAFKVDRRGKTPVRLMDNYFNNIHVVTEHPVTSAWYFSDSGEGYHFPTRKGYKGPNNADIKSYDPKTKTLTAHTKHEGKDLYHSIDAKGNIYFISDRHNGEDNLYRLAQPEPVRLTDFDSSIRQPQVSADGRVVVFEKDYQLHAYHTDSGKTQKVSVALFRDNRLGTAEEFNVSGNVTHFDVSPDGKKFAVVSRGELFVSGIKGKFIRQLETGPGRVIEVKWLADSRCLLYNCTTDNGWLNLFKIDSQSGKTTSLTDDTANNRNLALDPEKKRVLYLSGGDKLKIMDLGTFKSKTLVTDELWAYYNAQPRFSPDGKYIAFVAYRDMEEDIFIHHLDSGKTTNLTKSGVSESSPYWSPDGKYLFFSCNRFHPANPFGNRDAKIYRLPLKKYPKPFKSAEWDKLFEKDDKKKDDKKKGDKGKDDKKKAKVEVGIDYDRLNERWERFSPSAGTQMLPYVYVQGEKTMVIFASNHDGERYNLWVTTTGPFEKPKTQKIKGATIRFNDPFICNVNGQYYALLDKKVGTLDLKGGAFKPISMSCDFRRNLAQEFRQMFFEVWAGIQENFYHEGFHGRDWKKIRDRYARFLPHLHSRFNLRILVADMLGELNASHMGFRSSGKEEKTYYHFKTAQTGLVFEVGSPYRVRSVVADSPLDREDVDIRPGDMLVAVNGRDIDPGQNREYYFSAPSIPGEMAMTFKREEKGLTRRFTVKAHPFDTRRFRGRLYDEWIRDNQQRVDEIGGKRIAYIHMKNMLKSELDRFLIQMTTEWYNRDALILDLRFNNGGNIHDAVLNFLSQRPYSKWKNRDGKFAIQPNFTPAVKPIVVLINQRTLSDGEFTAVGFKHLKLGTVIGTGTYRWLIFTTGKGLVDGSFYRLPSWGCYSLDGGNVEKTGAKPDIYVDTTIKDRLEGRDPQLETAVKHILKQLN